VSDIFGFITAAHRHNLQILYAVLIAGNLCSLRTDYCNSIARLGSVIFSSCQVVKLSRCLCLFHRCQHRADAANTCKDDEAQTETAALSIFEILQEAPRLLEVMPRDIAKQFTATCSQLRHEFRRQVISITINSAEDAAALSAKDWPCLVEVCLKDCTSSAVSTILSNNRMKRLQYFTLQDHNLAAETDSAFANNDWSCMLRRLQLHRCTVEAGALILACLTEACWPLLEHVALTYIKLSACHVEALVNCTLPCLKQLDLTNTGLDIVGVQYLAEGPRPLLDTLILTLNALDEKCVALLTNSDWPLLQTLRLSYSCVGLSAFAILSISKNDLVMASWAQALPSRNSNCNLQLLVRQGNSNFWPKLRDDQVVCL